MQLQLITSEEWRPIVGYEDTYSVSSLGRVRRDRDGPNTWAGRILTAVVDPDGYLRVSLSRKNVQRSTTVHKLVTTAFLGPRPVGHSINHIDGVKTNNSPGNLEYVTPRANQEHASRTGLLAFGDRNGSRVHPGRVPRGETNGHAVWTATMVQEARELRAQGWKCARLARHFGVPYHAMWHALHGQSWKHVDGPISASGRYTKSSS